MRRLITWLSTHHVNLAIAGAMVLTLTYFTISLVQHNHFQSYGYDLGIFDQMVWKYSRFIGLYNTVKERVLLVDHMNLTLLLLAPLYWVWSDVRMLLFFQAVWLGFSSLGIYLIARRRGVSSLIAFGITMSYGLFYGMQEAIFYNFHASIIGVGLMPWVAYFLETKKRKLMWTAVTLLILTQENMGIALFSLGCLYFMDRRYRKTVIQWMVLGILYTLIMPWIISHLSVRGNEFAPTLPSAISGYVTQFFDSPDKRQVWVWSFGSFAFLPLLSPAAVAAVVVDLFQYFLSGPDFMRNWTTYTHHRAMLSIFLSLGALEVICRFKNKHIRNAIACCVCAGVLLSQFAWHLPVLELANRDYWKTEQWMNDIQALLPYIPTQSRVAAQNSIVPHISQRPEIYVIWPVEFPATDVRCQLLQPDKPCWWFGIPDNTDTLVVDTRPDQDTTAILETNEHWRESLLNMENAGVITVEKSIGTARIYKVRPIAGLK